MCFDEGLAELISLSLGASAEGEPADRPDLHGDLPGVPAALGRGLARIHGTRFPHHLAPIDVDEVIERRLQSGAITAADMPDPYNRYTPDRLVEILSGLPSPVDEPPVLCVGSATVDRFRLHEGEVCAVNGPAGVVGDRHLDLAALQHSIHQSLGAEAVFGFYEAYGSDPKIIPLDRAALAGLLLGWIT